MSTASERLTDALYGLGWATVRKLPEPVAAGLGRRIADTVWKRRGQGVLRLEANLARVVPDASPERLAELSKAGMRSYMRYWMESFRLPSWSAERVARSVDIEDIHHLTDGSRCPTWPTGTWRACGRRGCWACRSRRSPSG
jgi:KDO2-lipid IV(A) lauroyltransferase